MISIYDRLIHALGQEPSRSGLRLKPERELAGIFNVHYQSIKYAMNKLEQRGFIERRRGSGTFVRKVPMSVSDRSSSAELFITGESGRLVESDKPMRPLEVALWGFWNDSRFSEAATRNGIRDRLERDGHRATVFAFEQGQWSPEALHRAYKQSGLEFDAALVFTSVAESFNQLFMPYEQPLLYLLNAPESIEFRHQPFGELDRREFFERALLILEQSGYREAACLTLGALQYSDEGRFRYCCDNHNVRCAGVATPDLEVSQVIRVIDEMLPTGHPEKWPEALLAADDILLHLALPFMLRNGVRPGENIGIITLSNAGLPLPGSFHWSRLEFDPYYFGRQAAELVLRKAQHAGEGLHSFACRATWIPGETLNHNLHQTQ